MDWTKAKNILIVALIVTNLVLIFAYAKSPDKSHEVDREAIFSYMETKNIFIDAEIPVGQKKMSVVEVSHSGENARVVSREIKGWEVIAKKERTDENLQEKTEEFLIRCNFDRETVKLKSISRFEDQIIVEYKNQLGNIPVEQSYMIFTIENGKLVDFQRKWLDILDLNKTKQAVIPSEDALMKFTQDMNNAGNNEKITVEKMELVYWLDYKSIEGETPKADTALPAWKITYNGETVTYVPAYKQ